MPKDNLKSKAKVGAYWQFFNQISNNGIQFIIGIVMARLLTPEDYGITALPAVFYAIANVFIECGFSAAMVRKPELTDEDLSTSFYYSTAVGILCYILLFFSSPLIADFFNVPILTSLIRVTALTFLWVGLLTPQNIILNRKLDFKTPTIISAISKTFMGVIGISAAYFGYGVWALVISTVSSSFLTVILTCLLVRWFPRSGWSKESFNFLWNFGNKMIVTFLIDRVYLNITPFFIGKFYTPAQLGEYNRAQTYAQLPSQQFSNLLYNISYPIMSKMLDDIEYLRNNYRRFLKLAAFVVFPIMILMAVLAKPLVLILITEKWISCVPYLQLMCLALMWAPIHSLNLSLLLVKGRSDLFLRLEIIKTVIGLIIMALTLPIGIIPFIIGTIVHSLLCLFINTYYTDKILNVGYIRQMRDIMPTLLLCTLMAGISYLVLSFFSNYYLQLIIGGLVGVFIYVICSYIFNFSEIKDVIYLISYKKNK